MTRFYVGTHQPNWLWSVDFPLFVSHRRLAARRWRSPRRARVAWALDSGGFTELALHGRWRTTPDAYVEAVTGYMTHLGRPDFVAPQDWMTLLCASSAGADVDCPDRQHEIVWLQFVAGAVRRSLQVGPRDLAGSRVCEELAHDLPQWYPESGWRREGQLVPRQRGSRAPQLPCLDVVPDVERRRSVVVQRPDPFTQDRRALLQRRDNVRRKQRATFVDRRRQRPRVLASLNVSRDRVKEQWFVRDFADPGQQHGISMPNRSATRSVLRPPPADGGLRLHGFGVKTGGLDRYGPLLASADSMAWSYGARRDPPLPGWRGHINCANCPRYARRWQADVLARLNAAHRRPRQPALFDHLTHHGGD